MSDKKVTLQPTIPQFDLLDYELALTQPLQAEDAPDAEEKEEAPSLGQQEPFRGNILAGWIAG